jgi:hypothetical protein
LFDGIQTDSVRAAYIASEKTLRVFRDGDIDSLVEIKDLDRAPVGEALTKAVQLVLDNPSLRSFLQNPADPGLSAKYDGGMSYSYSIESFDQKHKWTVECLDNKYRVNVGSIRFMDKDRDSHEPDLKLRKVCAIVLQIRTQIRGF